jgi:hypothetical protein
MEGKVDLTIRILIIIKLIFAFVPPTDYLGGWACFIISIVGIGVMTAVRQIEKLKKEL